MLPPVRPDYVESSGLKFADGEFWQWWQLEREVRHLGLRSDLINYLLGVGFKVRLEAQKWRNTREKRAEIVLRVKQDQVSGQTRGDLIVDKRKVFSSKLIIMVLGRVSLKITKMWHCCNEIQAEVLRRRRRSHQEFSESRLGSTWLCSSGRGRRGSSSNKSLPCPYSFNLKFRKSSLIQFAIKKNLDFPYLLDRE